ncbi:phosphotransferase family protein [Motiliproteus sediminis]|uniref:phosphotransferase family protein n=1 Tax=Motiliproteus sediminis TaxID=1468178 RepID=UPI001AEFA459
MNDAPRLQRQHGEARKQLRPESRLDAPSLARLSAQLQAEGVPTPRCHADGERRLRYRWIDAVSARTEYSDEVAGGDLHWPPSATLAELLPPLVALHRARTDPAPPLLDPGWRIDERLADTRDDELDRCWQRLRAAWQPWVDAVVHGDFHLGQLLLLQPPRHGVQLIDLEDCASGPPEFDLGNFAAHLATAATTFNPERYQQLLTRVSAAYQQAGGRHVNQQRLAYCGQICLLRRYLKQRAAQPDTPPLTLRRWLLETPVIEFFAG